MVLARYRRIKTEKNERKKEGKNIIQVSGRSINSSRRISRRQNIEDDSRGFQIKRENISTWTDGRTCAGQTHGRSYGRAKRLHIAADQ